MHSNIGSSALFAATSGASVATAATIRTVAVPQIAKRGYNELLFLGTIAAGGTLGILIPPSINLLPYGLLTNTSVPELYLAGFIPGLLLAGLFMGTVVILCLINRLGVVSACVISGVLGCGRFPRQSHHWEFFLPSAGRFMQVWPRRLKRPRLGLLPYWRLQRQMACSPLICCAKRLRGPCAPPQ